MVALALQLSLNPDKVKIIEKDISKKANLAINILLNALDKKFDIDHVYMV